MNDEAVLLTLIDIFGKNAVLFDTESRNKYGIDYTQYYSPDPVAVVFPKNEEQLVSLVQLANKLSLKLVPSGGRTGYSGGAIAAFKEIVVSFEKMNKILSFCEEDRSVRCQPGLITKELQEFAKTKDLFYPVDFASSGSSQIGGNIATNAGGIKVIRYGLTRNWVTGLRVVTGNGEILELNNGLIKNATGYDFLNLFIGSEGTLGFITEATIKLIEEPLPQKVVLFSLNQKNHLLNILNKCRTLRYLSAFELFSDKALQIVLKEQSLTMPFSKSAPFYVLLEFDSTQENETLLFDVLESSLSSQSIGDVIISDSIEKANNLWKFRESISLSLRKYIPYKYDISVVPSRIIQFMSEVDGFLEKENQEIDVIWFGHVGDGNLHLNILKPKTMEKEKFFTYCDKISTSIYELVKKYSGSISAEHGIGLLKKPFLSYSKSDTEIAYMKLIKKLFDENNVMNPLKLV
jgi:FAD/FMN-containing dehydrogenase